MEMSQEIRCFATRQAEAPATSAETTIYTHPDEVIRDSKPTLAEKKAILASWASDARAVEDAPSLRQLDSGAVVEVEAVLQALVALEDRSDTQECWRQPVWRQRRGKILRWLGRGWPSDRSNDDDDDPPPAPAGFGIPFRPLVAEAHGVYCEAWAA
jgi:hypothetical protein